MKGHNFNKIKEYLDTKGYNTAFASEDELNKMLEDDQLNKKRVENDTRK
jgi:hypothetical protein